MSGNEAPTMDAYSQVQPMSVMQVVGPLQRVRLLAPLLCNEDFRSCKCESALLYHQEPSADTVDGGVGGGHPANEGITKFSLTAPPRTRAKGICISAHHLT